MIKDIKELNFPAYATLETATATIADMGDRTITSQVKIDGDVVPDFSYDWEVEFKGERYIHPVKTPQGTKDNTSRKSKIDLVFQHWAIYEMKRQYFVEMASTTAGTAIADKYIASLGLNLGDFVTAFNLVLNHYFNGRIVIRPNPEWQYDAEAKFVSISYSYIWDVLQQMHEIYGVRWTIKTNADGVCEILMGYPAEEVSHIFEYGFEGGLLSVQRQVQSTNIRNRLLGRGGEKNLPYRYFKDADPNNPLFKADPDWVPELANIAFTELRGKTFRDYVRGWKAKRYGGTPMAEPTEAYLIGYNADKFDPIEYVDDKESIEKYGVLVGALENNEDVYPSIQGAPGEVDMIVDAEQVTDDNVDDAVEDDSVESNIEGSHYTKSNVTPNKEVSIAISVSSGLVYFTVPEGKKGTILTPSFTVKGGYRKNTQSGSSYVHVDDGLITVYHDKCTFSIYDKTTKQQVSGLNIPPGEYYYKATVVASHTHTENIHLTASVSNIRLIVSTDNSSKWSQTFNVWVRNIWGSSRNAGETDQQYADRVWAPILGDREGNEARVVFASGWLSFCSDWEFPIVGYAYDDSKEGSHWRLTLAKSEAELEASGKYIPYEGYNASAGDRFFFIGIDMPYQYVLWAEERLDNFKRDSLLQTAQINPTWVIKTDKVRLNEDRNGVKLINQLNIGAQIRIASKQFISGAYEGLYVQSMTYNWTADTILYPDVEVVVSDKVATVKNPVAQIQGNIEALQKQVGSLSNIQQIIRQVCDTLYLRKDGVSDISKSPTKFLGKVTGEKFRQGQIGGRDWGIYRDENGNAIFEADKFVARQGILVSDLVVNEATYVGGLQINSAASLNVKTVNEDDDGYVCFFDQKQGSVTNKFKVDDVAFCQQFDAGDTEVKFYKSRVIAVDEGSITISKTEINGTGIPAEDDVIIHYGNYTDKNRQFVITRDVIGGGYERMLMGLDSVESDGVEYYFAGKSADSTARWFVGSKEQFAEYKDGQLTIKGNIFVTGSDKNISEQIARFDFIREAFGENAQGLILGTAIIVGYTDENGNFVPMAGLSGVYNKDAENGGPAAWYGGTPENAKSVIFMDGTGYFADGLFKWDRDKGVNLGNGAIKINYDGSVDFGGNIRIGSTGEETLDSLLTIVAKLSKMWSLENGVLKTNYPILSKGYAAGATATVGEGGGGSGSIIFNGPWSDYTSDKADYALAASLGYDLHTRITSLEGKATNVKFTQAIAAGKQIGSISIDGQSTNLYAPSTYAWSEITDRPTKLSQFTDDVVSGKYLPLSGGMITGTDTTPLNINTSATKEVGLRFLMSGSDKAWVGYTPNIGVHLFAYSNHKLGLTDAGIGFLDSNTLIHSGNYSDYALRLTGNQYYYFADSSGVIGSLTQDNSLNNTWYIVGKTGDYNILLHSNNIGKYAALSNQGGIDLSVTNLNHTGYGYSGTGWLTSGPAIAVGSTDGYTMLIQQGTTTQTLYVSCKTLGESPMAWKQIAFTDSDITGNAATATNADTLDGYHADSFAKKLYLGTTDLNSIDNSLLGQQISNERATTELHYPVQEAGGLISILSAYESTNQIYGTYNSNRWFARGSGYGLSSRTSWREFAFTDSTVDRAKILVDENNAYLVYKTGAGNLYVGDNIYISGGETHILGNSINLMYGTSASYGFILNSSGNVGIGTTSPQYKLDVNGTVRFGTGYGCDVWLNRISGNSYINAVDSIAITTGNNSGNIAFELYANKSAMFYGAVTMSSALAVSGATTLSSTLSVTGRATIAGGITSNANHDLIFAGNEFNFIPDNYSDAIYINYRTASGSYNGNVTEYIFSKGAGLSYANIRCNNLYAAGNTLTIGSATLTWNGSALVVDKPLVSTSFAAGATATASSSDMRLKTVDSDISLDIHSIANAPLFNYHLNEHSSDFQMVGSSAQYWMSILPKSVIEDGTDSHFLSLFYDRVALASAITTARVVVSHENRITELEEIVRAQEEEIKYLKGKLN